MLTLCVLTKTRTGPVDSTSLRDLESTKQTFLFLCAHGGRYRTFNTFKFAYGYSKSMDKTKTFISANNEQLDEITRLLLQQRDVCNQRSSHSVEREDEKEMRRLERTTRHANLYGQLEKLGTEVEGLRQSIDTLLGPAPFNIPLIVNNSQTDTLMEVLQQNHLMHVAEITAFRQGKLVYKLEDLRSWSAYANYV